MKASVLGDISDSIVIIADNAAQGVGYGDDLVYAVILGADGILLRIAYAR